MNWQSTAQSVQFLEFNNLHEIGTISTITMGFLTVIFIIIEHLSHTIKKRYDEH